MLNLSQLRIELQLTQSELAEKLRVSLRTIQNWENDPASIPKKKISWVTQELEKMRNLDPGSLELKKSPLIDRIHTEVQAGKMDKALALDIIHHIERLTLERDQLQERVDYIDDRENWNIKPRDLWKSLF